MSAAAATPAVHRVLRVAQPPGSWEWDAGPWADAPSGRVASFHPRSSSHRPDVQFKLLNSGAALHVLFQVRDCFVICRHTEPNTAVFKDSCVEAFLDPDRDGRYLNFELNCGGALLAHRRMEAGVRRSGRAIPREQAARIGIFKTMPRTVLEEIQEPVDWRAGMTIPYEVLATQSPAAGAQWKANFYKCADDSSHPHWAAWSSVGDVLNFHQPERFGTIIFA